MDNVVLEEQTPVQTKAVRSKKIKWVMIVVAACVVVGIVYGACTLVKINRTYEIIAQLDGKLFVWEPANHCKVFYAFQDGKIAYEEWSSWGADEVYGDITQYNEPKARPDTFQNGFRIWVSDDGRGWLTLYVNKAGEIMYSEDGNNNWREIALDEYSRLKLAWGRAQCDHAFGENKVVTKATCSSAGKESAVCSKCQYEKTWETDRLPHVFDNKKCKLCGAEYQQTGSLSFADYMQWLKDYAEKENFLGVTNLTQLYASESPAVITYSCEYDENLVYMTITEKDGRVVNVRSLISPYTIVDKGIASNMTDAQMVAYSLALEPIVGINEKWDHSWHLQQFTDAEEQGNSTSIERTYTKDNWSFTVIIGDALVSVSASDNSVS